MRRTATGLVLLLGLAFVLGPAAIAKDDDESLIDKDPFSLEEIEQKARVYEILAKAGFEGDVTPVLRNARHDAELRILEQVIGMKIFYGREVMRTLEKEYTKEEIETRLKRSLIKNVRIVAWDAYEDGTVVAYAKFRLWEVVRDVILEKDWDRLEWIVKDVQKKYPHDFEAVGHAVVDASYEPEGKEEGGKELPPGDKPGPATIAFERSRAKAFARIGDRYPAHAKRVAFDTAKRRALMDIIQEVKGVILEEYAYISSACPSDVLQKKFAAGEVRGARYTRVIGVPSGTILVKAEIKLVDFIREVVEEKDWDALEYKLREKITKIERNVVGTGEAHCDPKISESYEPQWEAPAGEVR